MFYPKYFLPLVICSLAPAPAALASDEARMKEFHAQFLARLRVRLEAATGRTKVPALTAPLGLAAPEERRIVPAGE